GGAPPARSLRVGVVDDGFCADRVHPEALAAVEAVGRVFEELGHPIEAVDGTGLSEVRRAWMGVCCPEFAEAYPDLRGERLGLVSPQPRSWLEEGMAMSAEDRAEAAHRRAAVMAWFDSRLSDTRVLVVPIPPYPAYPAEATEVALGDGRSV